ncbi:unnamed protein product [Leptidea sinapis]|uniref:Uncharacterized protein n=1 Tax=Leptidea sinapis TaxID=189913 RepID=A0A5E4Q8R3_9NEOP|nr:unnamed protein product [Leptidea sinapis]
MYVFCLLQHFEDIYIGSRRKYRRVFALSDWIGAVMLQRAYITVSAKLRRFWVKTCRRCLAVSVAASISRARSRDFYMDVGANKSVQSHLGVEPGVAATAAEAHDTLQQYQKWQVGVGGWTSKAGEFSDRCHQHATGINNNGRTKELRIKQSQLASNPSKARGIINTLLDVTDSAAYRIMSILGSHIK